MTSSRRARVTTGARDAQPGAPVEPDRIVFIASARGDSSAGESMGAVVLCWPTVPQAWVGIGHSLRAMLEERGKTLPGVPLPERASWLRDCAPQLAAPFQRTALAEEASVAALLSRTPMRVAIAVTGVDPRRAAVTKFHGTPLEVCLTTFDHEARSASQRDCALAISTSQPDSIQVEYRDGLKAARDRLPGSIPLRGLQLDFWPGGTEPLPLELAKVVATSVLRHLQSGGDVDSVFDAAKTKFANDPFPRGWGKSRLRRTVRSGS